MIIKCLDIGDAVQCVYLCIVPVGSSAACFASISSGILFYIHISAVLHAHGTHGNQMYNNTTRICCFHQRGG